MSMILSKSRQSEEHIIHTKDNCSLCAIIMKPRPSKTPQRVVLIVPLAGAGAGQQLMVFRDFARRGAIVISYEYRGHPRSTGLFDLDSTIVDTHHALGWALDYANQIGLPLHGFTTCFGAIPLLAQFKKGGYGPRLRSVTTIAGLYHLHQIMHVKDFAPYFTRQLGMDMDEDALIDGIERGTIDCDGIPVRKALRDYLLSLMPELRIDLERFEDLYFDRIDIRRMLMQFARADYLQGIEVPRWMPCTAVVGRRDWLLGANTDEGCEQYKRRVASLIPHAKIFELEMDHFGDGPDHEAMVHSGSEAFERADAAAATAAAVIPPHHIETPLYRSLPR